MAQIDAISRQHIFPTLPEIYQPVKLHMMALPMQRPQNKADYLTDVLGTSYARCLAANASAPSVLASAGNMVK